MKLSEAEASRILKEGKDCTKLGLERFRGTLPTSKP